MRIRPDPIFHERPHQSHFLGEASEIVRASKRSDLELGLVVHNSQKSPFECEIEDD
jgi:hypothetical protein